MATPQGGCPQAAGPIKRLATGERPSGYRCPTAASRGRRERRGPPFPSWCRCATRPATSRLLADEIATALDGRWRFEVVYVNDGSTDATEAELDALKAEQPWLRQIKHASSCGQSAAVRSGVEAAHAPLVVTLDGDGQNDPSFIPALLHALRAGGAANRPDRGPAGRPQAAGFKKFQSRIANGVRGAILNDGTRDTGCGLKAFPRDAFLALPYFEGLHRFLPALFRRQGYAIGYVDVIDRPRRARQVELRACGTGCGSASSICPACGGSSAAATRA